MDDHLSIETHGFGDTQFEETTKMSVKPCLWQWGECTWRAIVRKTSNNHEFPNG
jgi:hypothetical protein